MKTITLSVLLVGITAFTMMPDETLSADDLKQSCKTLSLLTNTAIKKQKRASIVIYYQAYKAIREEYTITEDCDRFFNEVRDKHAASNGTWNINLNSPPKINLNGGNGGFTHKDIDLLNKLKSMQLSESDLDLAALVKKLENNTVDVNLLSTSLDRVNAVKQNMNKINFQETDTARLNRIKTENIKIEEFKKLTGY